MKTVIIYNHPYEGSFCHAILETVIQSIIATGNEVDVIDLYKDKFNPIMTENDLLAFIKHEAVDQQAINYIERLQQADHIIFIFPIWWELMPAQLKGFLDKVIFPGSVYDYTKSGYGMRSRLHKLKSTTVITTMNTPKSIYRVIYGNAIYKAMMKGTMRKIGFKNVKWISFHMVKGSSLSTRQKWLTIIKKHVENNF